MSETGMKNKVASGLFWKLLENGGAQGIQFVIAILLARLLTPAEYGVVGIIMIFITIANVFVQSGFSTALVQKKQAHRSAILNLRHRLYFTHCCIWWHRSLRSFMPFRC